MPAGEEVVIAERIPAGARVAKKEAGKEMPVGEAMPAR